MVKEWRRPSGRSEKDSGLVVMDTLGKERKAARAEERELKRKSRERESAETTGEWVRPFL